MKQKEIIKNVIENKRIESVPDYRDMGAILLFIFLLPYIVSFFFGNVGVEKETLEEAAENKAVEIQEEMFQEDFSETEYIVCNKTAAGTEMIPMETYLVSRLPATIDMSYESETLKAQAIVLRTELMRSYYKALEKDVAGDVLTEPETVQRKKAQNEDAKKYIYIESNLPKVNAQAYEKSKAAVGSTQGIYMVYEGVPISAPYFAISAGRTRNGNEAFHNEDYPYLKSVACERDFTAENYVQTVKMSKGAFYERLWELIDEKNATEQQKEEQLQVWLSGEFSEIVSVQRDQTGYVTDVSLNQAYLSGEGVRAAFLLNSSCFEWEEEKNTINIKVKGVGHGLGFCQYGANEAAKKGSDYIDILKYFFTDIVIEKSR